MRVRWWRVPAPASRMIGGSGSSLGSAARSSVTRLDLGNGRRDAWPFPLIAQAGQGGPAHGGLRVGY
jgi:hypothetical protein